MLYLLLSLWIIAFILIWCNPREKSIIWGSMIAIFGSFGGAANVLEKDFLPYFLNKNYNHLIISILRVTIGLLYSLAHYISPYTCLMFGIVYSNLFNFNRKSSSILMALLFVPIVVMYILCPFYPMFITCYPVLVAWAVPYIFLGNILLIYSFFREKNRKIRQQRLLLILVEAPPTLFAAFTNYLYPLFGIFNTYKNNVIIVIILLILFMMFAAKYGVLGVKVKFEKQYFNDTIKTISTTTSIINHTIKNEALIINMCVDEIKKCISNNNNNKSDKKIIEKINVINLAADHMQDMMARIQEKTQQIMIDKQSTNLKEIIENALIVSKPLFDSKNISVIEPFSIDVIIKIDKVHIQEVLCNILKNAVEAMNDKGELKICLDKTKNEVIILIQDNGSGISPENLSQVFEPFFSTKNRHLNYGLGLSYCYNVMLKHNGTIEILSEANKGTKVLLKFPLQRLENSIHRGGFEWIK